jgi:hypothetical protein
MLLEQFKLYSTLASSHQPNTHPVYLRIRTTSLSGISREVFQLELCYRNEHGTLGTLIKKVFPINENLFLLKKNSARTVTSSYRKAC